MYICSVPTNQEIDLTTIPYGKVGNSFCSLAKFCLALVYCLDVSFSLSW